MTDCENQNNFDTLEKIISNFSKIVGKNKEEAGCSYLLEGGNAHIYFLNNAVFELSSYKKDPLKVINEIVHLYGPKKANGTYFCNESVGLNPAQNLIDPTGKYFYQTQNPVPDTIEIKINLKSAFSQSKVYQDESKSEKSEIGDKAIAQK